MLLCTLFAVARAGLRSRGPTLYWQRAAAVGLVRPRWSLSRLNLPLLQSFEASSFRASVSQLLQSVMLCC